MLRHHELSQLAFFAANGNGAESNEEEDESNTNGLSSGDDSEGAHHYAKLSSLSKSLFPEDKDQLNLAGLLEVLDGVVDCPGRIVSKVA